MEALFSDKDLEIKQQKPIGLFDSGVGGLTVLKALREKLPAENIVYFGDAVNMPYGEKTNGQIISMANAAMDFLASKNVKAVLLACNTVSSLMKELTTPLHLFSIIEAGCLRTLELKEKGPVGLIATTATVRNKAYDKLLKKYTVDVHYVSQGTHTLAKVINDQSAELPTLRGHIRDAVSPILENPQVSDLLLGCTHFPIVRETIAQMYPGLRMIDPADKQCMMIKHYLVYKTLLNHSKEKGKVIVYHTGDEKDRRVFVNLLDQLEIDYSQLITIKHTI